MLNVPVGEPSVLFARMTRKNGFAGEVQLAIAGLPRGVTATCGRIPADRTDGCIILQAAPKAPISAANVRITGPGFQRTGTGPPVRVSAIAYPVAEK